jgi:tagatose 6-phosphate kinase
LILTVTLNPALDLTYTVDALVPHAVHRVTTVTERAGGKGLNVARVLDAAGEPVVATGLLGGATGARIQALLGSLRREFVGIVADSRRTVAVVDRHDATGFWEPGPAVAAHEWDAFRTRYADLLDTAEVVVLAGSLPPGVPVDGYAQLVAAARQRTIPVVLDADGEALRRALPAGPTVVKPNADELAAATDERVVVPVADAAARLCRAGAGSTVVSLGPRGLLAVTPQGRWRAVPPEIMAGNSTGAGDACVAALARGLRNGQPWPATLADAVALSAAAVAAPVAGTVDEPTYRRLRPTVVVDEV